MKDTKENRIKFLSDNGALSKFKKNIENHSHLKLKDALDPDETIDFIGGPFWWNATQEGREYWADLCIKWDNKIISE